MMPAPHAPSGCPPGGRILVLNCVEDRIQFALVEKNQVRAHQQWLAPARVMGRLTSTLEQALRWMELDVRDLQGIACVRGPGNFTGVRTSLAVTYGLALGANLPMAGLDYLPLLAAGPGPLLRGYLAVLTHARRQLVYAQLFAVPGMTALTRPQVLDLEGARLQALLSGDPSGLAPECRQPLAEHEIHLLGSGVHRNPERFERLASRVRILSAAWDHAQADALCTAASLANYSAQPVVPLYLRHSDAEDNLRVFAAQRGLSLDEAQQRLEPRLDEHAVHPDGECFEKYPAVYSG